MPVEKFAASRHTEQDFAPSADRLFRDPKIDWRNTRPRAKFTIRGKNAPLMPARIVILSGPVGSGKTTVARELLALLPSPAAYIEGDTFWSFLVKGSSRGPTPESFRAIMASMTAAAVPLATGGRHVLLDFSIPPWFLGTAKAIASVRQLPVHFVVLRPSQAVCAQRAATRSAGAIADYARFQDLYHDFDNVGVHAVCDDTASPSETARAIMSGIEAGQFLVR